jgi:hypothetical protein
MHQAANLVEHDRLVTSEGVAAQANVIRGGTRCPKWTPGVLAPQADQPVGAKCPIGIKPSKIFFFEFRPIHWIIENYRPNFKSMLEIGT